MIFPFDAEHGRTGPKQTLAERVGLYCRLKDNVGVILEES
jgi:hypothetical protein